PSSRAESGVRAEREGNGTPPPPAGGGGVEGQAPAAHRGARVIRLDDVKRPRHDTHVDPFLRRAVLDVVDIAAERDEKPVPRALWVEGGEHSRIGDKAQRRAVRSPPVVVRDGPRGRVGTVAVPQPRKDLAQVLARDE